MTFGAAVGLHEGKSAISLESCVAEDLAARAMIQNRLASICEDMCKSVGAYPKCQCPSFTSPGAGSGSASGDMEWPDLLKFIGDVGKRNNAEKHEAVSLPAQGQDSEGHASQQG